MEPANTKRTILRTQVQGLQARCRDEGRSVNLLFLGALAVVAQGKRMMSLSPAAEYLDQTAISFTVFKLLSLREKTRAENHGGTLAQQKLSQKETL